MVDKTKQNTEVEMYRPDFATPVTVEAMRFWVQNELRRIQKGFRSADERIRAISVDDEGEVVEGPVGPQGETGQDGRGIHTYQQQDEPFEAQPGDVWFKVTYL